MHNISEFSTVCSIFYNILPIISSHLFFHPFLLQAHAVTMIQEVSVEWGTVEGDFSILFSLAASWSSLSWGFF